MAKGSVSKKGSPKKDAKKSPSKGSVRDSKNDD